MEHMRYETVRQTGSQPTSSDTTSLRHGATRQDSAQGYLSNSWRGRIFPECMSMYSTFHNASNWKDTLRQSRRQCPCTWPAWRTAVSSSLKICSVMFPQKKRQFHSRTHAPLPEVSIPRKTWLDVPYLQVAGNVGVISAWEYTDHEAGSFSRRLHCSEWHRQTENGRKRVQTHRPISI